MTGRRMSLTPAQCRTRSEKGWHTRAAAEAWTPAQRAHYRAFYNTGLRKRLVRAGFCRSCCRQREAGRRQLTECGRCATVSAARAKRQPARRWIRRTQMRTAV